MTFSMFEIMAQAYRDKEHEIPIMPATIQTMTRAYTDICQGEDPWTALGNFTNAWYDYAKSIRPSLVNEPLVYPDKNTEYTCNWAAYCAASVEYLCGLYHLPCPTWVQNPCYILSHAWSGSNTFPAITEQRSKTTPPPFARRNIFCGSGMFRNKYEPFEWMLEAQRNGLTDPRAIRDYARQKEISLHGA
ncbi:MAG: hypothetical protein ABI234_14615 [Ktedonobacteraceae bacterium]